MPVAVTYVDNADGTGGVFSITGSNVASVNTVFVSKFSGSNAQRTFVSAGSRTGNGTVAWTATNGCFFAHASSVLAGVVELSAPIAVRVDDGTLSNYERVLIAVREYIMALALPGIATNPEQHVIAKMGLRLVELLRSANEGVYYVPTQEGIEGFDNAYATMTYPVNVVFVTKAGPNIRAGLSSVLRAREDTMLSFGASPLEDLVFIHSVDVVPGPVVDPAGFAQGYEVSVLTIEAKTESIDGLL